MGEQYPLEQGSPPPMTVPHLPCQGEQQFQTGLCRSVFLTRKIREEHMAVVHWRGLGYGLASIIPEYTHFSCFV